MGQKGIYRLGSTNPLPLRGKIKGHCGGLVDEGWERQAAQGSCSLLFLFIQIILIPKADRSCNQL